MDIKKRRPRDPEDPLPALSANRLAGERARTSPSPSSHDFIHPGIGMQGQGGMRRVRAVRGSGGHSQTAGWKEGLMLNQRLGDSCTISVCVKKSPRKCLRLKKKSYK